MQGRLSCYCELRDDALSASTLKTCVGDDGDDDDDDDDVCRYMS